MDIFQRSLALAGSDQRVGFWGGSITNSTNFLIIFLFFYYLKWAFPLHIIFFLRNDMKNNIKITEPSQTFDDKRCFILKASFPNFITSFFWSLCPFYILYDDFSFMVNKFTSFTTSQISSWSAPKFFDIVYLPPFWNDG